MACTVPTVKDFWHKESSTCSFVVYDPATKDAVVIDSVMDLDTVNWQVGQEHNEAILAFVKAEGLKVHYVMDTHVHADHITGAQGVKAGLGGAVPYAIGANITQVQATFAKLFGLGDFKCDGSQFDKLLQDKEVVTAGSLKVTCLATPGHTPNCMTFAIGDTLFAGDALFTEDFGTGRCDFPGGSAAALYDSVMMLYNSFPGETRVFVGHDYQPGGRELRVMTTIQLSKDKQEDLPASAPRDEFVKGKTEWDKTLNLPRMIFPSLLVNMNAGRLPPPPTRTASATS